MKETISWNGRSSATSLLHAEKELRENGNDIGWDRTYSLMPASDDHHHWMSFASYLTVVHNRDLSPKKYSIFRMVTHIVFIICIFIAEL